MEHTEKVLLTQRWIARAQKDALAASILIKKDIFNRQTCFWSQQAAEKAIKAGLIFLQIEFPLTHDDLEELKELLPDDWSCRKQHPDLDLLSKWSTECLYPTFTTDPSQQDAHWALAKAKAVIASITSNLEKQGALVPQT